MRSGEDRSVTMITKLLPPRRRGVSLVRENIARRFRLRPNKRLCLITAPAGYGKTSTLTQLYDSMAGLCPCAWITLDHNDNDVVRFTAHLMHALRISGVELGSGLANLLGPVRAPDPITTSATLRAGVLNALATLETKIFFFLDEFNVIHNPDVLHFVSALLLAPFSHLHFVIASRQQTALPLSRLRALDELDEIVAPDLAFTASEISALIDKSSLPSLSEAALQNLQNKTEGWCAAVQLALIAASGHTDATAFLSQLSGADKDIADFLVDEVLSHQPEELQHFLLATSIFDRFNVELCNSVLEREDSRTLIDLLESRNLFLFTLDRERIWYRYHYLFAQLLRKRLTESRPQQARHYHAKACEWFSERGEPLKALEHAFASHDFSTAGCLLNQTSYELFSTGESNTLREYANRLPPAVRDTLPCVQLDLAWEDIIRWRFDDAEDALEAVRKYLQSHPDADSNNTSNRVRAGNRDLQSELAHREVMAFAFKDQLDAALKAGKTWFSEHGHTATFASASIDTAMMMSRREQFDCELASAEQQSLRQRFLDANAVYGTVFLDTVVGNTLAARGELEPAREQLIKARATAIRISGEASILAAMPASGLVQIEYERNHLPEVSALLAHYRTLPLEFGLVDSIIGYQLSAARLARASADLMRAHRVLDVATHLADRYELPRLHAHVFGERVRLLLDEGLVRDAKQLAESARYAKSLESVTPGGTANTTKACLAMAKSRLLCERGQTADAIILARQWLTWSRDRRCHRYSIQFAVLLSRLYLRHGDHLAAQRSLREAVHYGESGGFIRSFIDEGAEVGILLKEILQLEINASSATHEYAQHLSDAFGIERKSASPQLPDDAIDESLACLSEREIEIIRLSAQNMVAREIGISLGLAESTVKWHWRQIFSKLGVNRRGPVIRAARVRGLLD